MPEVCAVKESKPIVSIAAWSKKAAKQGVGTASRFIQDTRSFLLRSDLAETTKPILDQLDRRELFPSAAINALFEALVRHEAKDLLQKAKEAIQKAEEKEERERFLVCVYGDKTLANPNGVLKAIHRCERGNDAERWADRYLSEHGGADYYALIDSKVEKTKLRIERLDAIARMYPKKCAAATVPTVRVSADRLSFGVGGQYNKPVYFSRG